MSEQIIYKDPGRPTKERVNDLLDRMTLEEKIGQMCQINGRDGAKKWLRKHHAGSFLHMLGEETNELQKLAEQSRLGIPILFGIDAIHGHAFWPTATVFPTQLALSCSWNPELVEEIGQITATEVAHTGVHWTFSPVLGIARDLRWGRIGETFGEDPYLIGVLGCAIIRGYQGDALSDPHTILACAKHYVGYSETQGGRDSSEADLSHRKMRSLFLRPFHKAVQAGCATVMSGYQAIDGVPCTSNRWLLKDVLRGEWGFDGFVVTDWKNIEHLNEDQKTSLTLEDATHRAINAGNDMMMNTPAFPETAMQLVQSGQLDVAHIDQAASNVLRLKFELGLFDENRYADLEKGHEIIGCEAHRQVALESAYQSLVLLKNQDNLLPLDKSNLKRIAVIGPNADDVQSQLGDWVSWSGQLGDVDFERDPASIVTVLQGIRQRVGDDVRVDYCRGCDAVTPNVEQIAEAADLAREADVAIVVVGDHLWLTGECHGRANLDLSGGQQQLLEAVHATGTPVVVVLVNSKPLTIPWTVEHIPAILEAWNPGMEGGTAVAGILFGDRNPSGKLTISFPHHVGQQPVHYNQIPGWHTDCYVDMPKKPLFAFGYGLSYTSFAYFNLRLSTKKLYGGETLYITVDVRNTGGREGSEIVQLYVNDVYSSVTTPVMELKAFQRVDLKPGENKIVRFQIPYEQLALVDRELRAVVEPGEFEIMVGASSRDQDLLKAKFEVQTGKPRPKSVDGYDAFASVKYFDSLAESYDVYRPHPPVDIPDILCQMAQVEQPQMVVDMGCGTGRSAFIWTKRANVIVGIEPNADMRRVAQARQAALPDAEHVHFRDTLASETELPNNCVDIVTCFQSLHWMDPGPTFAEVARILRPGGVFAAYDYGQVMAHWEMEAALDAFWKRMGAVIKVGWPSELRKWSQAEHITRMKNSGHFRYVKQIRLHRVEAWNAERLIGAMRSQSDVGVLLKQGFGEAEIGLDDLRIAAKRILGERSMPWYINFVVRLGIK